MVEELKEKTSLRYRDISREVEIPVCEPHALAQPPAAGPPAMGAAGAEEGPAL